ncbi:MAG: hypothetical protein ABR508_01060 [Candidatus Baltobacteraceae bacterium]
MLFAFVAAAGWVNRDRIRLKIASVYASVPPKASQTHRPLPRPHTNVAGDAPWALSALPECFTQVAKTTGPPPYVLAHLPAGLAMERDGARLKVADCALRVAGDAIFVHRGADHLRIPPPARLYDGPGQTAVLRSDAGGYELRVYTAQAPLVRP